MRANTEELSVYPQTICHVSGNLNVISRKADGQWYSGLLKTYFLVTQVELIFYFGVFFSVYNTHLDTRQLETLQKGLN